MATPPSLSSRIKKQLNDLLRRLTGYQFVKVEKLAALEAAAKKGHSRPSGRR